MVDEVIEKKWQTVATEIGNMLMSLTSNKALKAWINYKSNDKQKAVEYWEKIAEEDNDRGIRACRSLAVYFHSQAYEEEINKNYNTAKDFWRESHKYWQRLLNSEAFRNEIQILSKISSTSSIHHDDVEPLIEDLGKNLLAVHVAIAQQEFERKKESRSKQHIKTIRLSQFPESAVTSAIKNILESVCPIKHDTRIDHTTFTHDSAKEARRKGTFAIDMFPDFPNGFIMVLMANIWEIQVNLVDSNTLERTWQNYIEFKEKGYLERLHQMIPKVGGIESHLIKSLLTAYTNVGCDYELARINNWILDVNRAFEGGRSYEGKNLLDTNAEKATQALQVISDLKKKYGCDPELFRFLNERVEYSNEESAKAYSY